MLWQDLWFIFLSAHRAPVDLETIRGVYEFARWTYAESHNGELATSTCCHFYEHLPTSPQIRGHLLRFMSREEVLGLSEIFKYHLTTEGHREFMQTFGGPRVCS